MGKTQVQTALGRQDQIETPPRTWGRHRRVTDAMRKTMETPPRTWGRPIAVRCTPSRLETPPRTWGRRTSASTASFPAARNTPTHMGKTFRISFLDGDLGNTPTHMGKTSRQLMFDPNEETPPRTWGRHSEYTAHYITSRKHPHAHGEDGRSDRQMRKPRNTPTHMGKTEQKPDALYVMETPPRTWGRRRQWKSPWVSMTAVETPPRTWGRHHESVDFSTG